MTPTTAIRTALQTAEGEVKEGLERALEVIEASEKAYGCLWRSHSLDAISTHARKLILDAGIGREGQRRGIAYALSKYGSIDPYAELHLMP